MGFLFLGKNSYPASFLLIMKHKPFAGYGRHKRVCFSWIKSINQFLWSGPLLFLLMGSHLYFTMKLHFPQKNIWKAIRLSLLPSGNGKQQNLSAFATLSATLAATLGTGNIVGVSTAIALGARAPYSGAGSPVFWAWPPPMRNAFSACAFGAWARMVPIRAAPCICGRTDCTSLLPENSMAF